jgi:tetratricopeptide (TPR) repeat protein
MQTQPATASESATVVPPRGLPRTSRWRRIALLAAVAAIVLTLTGGFWFATRFDPLGHVGVAYGRHQYQAALKAARDHLARFPDDRAASLTAARCLTRMGRPVEAEPYYRRAGTLGPDDLQARAYGLVQSGDVEGAVRVYEELLAQRPADPLALKRLAALRMGRKEWQATLELADRVRAIPSEEVAGLTLAAIGHHESRHHAQAVEASRRVAALDPELKTMPLPRTLFWNNMALDLMALGRFDEARAVLERALDGREDAGLMEVLGFAYFHQGQMEEAERCWLRAERWDPNNADVYIDLGRLALVRQRWKDAVGFFKRASELSPTAVAPLYNLSQAYGMLGNRAEADRYRRLADERRRSQPAPQTGMGADIEDALRGVAREMATPEPAR